MGSWLGFSSDEESVPQGSMCCSLTSSKLRQHLGALRSGAGATVRRRIDQCRCLAMGRAGEILCGLFSTAAH